MLLFLKRNNFSDKDLRNLEYLKDQKKFFFKEQSDLKEIDNTYLDHFEKNIAISNIWKMISADRNYGRSYINDIYGYDSIYTNKNSYEILLNFVEVAKGIEKIFKTFKPDAVFIPNGVSNIDVTIIESLSKYYKIRFLTPGIFDMKIIFFSDNLKIETLKIKESYFRTKKKFKDNKKLNQIYKRLTGKKILSVLMQGRPKNIKYIK